MKANRRLTAELATAPLAAGASTGVPDGMDRQVERRRFVVGLGNPGRRYARTRHNVGWMVLAALRRRWRVDSGRLGFNGRLYEARPVGPDGKARAVKLFEPLTYMNRSGQAVAALANFYRLDYPDVLVVLDDMALPVGRIRIRAGGSDGGHNGLKDILNLLGSQQVPRLRIGVGPAPQDKPWVEHVLTEFDKDELEVVESAIDKAADAVEDWLAFGIDYVMDRYNATAES